MSGFGHTRLSLAAFGVQLPLRASSPLVLGHVFPAIREVVRVPDRGTVCLPLRLSLQGLFLPVVCQKEAALFLEATGTPGEGKGCFVPWLRLAGKPLGDLYGPGLVSKVYAEPSPALLTLRYWARSLCVCKSNSSLLPWLCSVCWQRATRVRFSTGMRPAEPGSASWADVEQIQGLV